MTGGVACSTDGDLLGCESRLLSSRGSASALSLHYVRDTARGTLLRASFVQNSSGEHRMHTQWIDSALRPPPFSCRARTPGQAHRCLGGTASRDRVIRVRPWLEQANTHFASPIIFVKTYIKSPTKIEMDRYLRALSGKPIILQFQFYLEEQPTKT